MQTSSSLGKPLRIVITMPLAERLGGSEKMLWTILRHHDRMRLEPIVVFLQPGPFEREVAGLGVGTHVVDAGRLRDVDAAVRTVRGLSTLLRVEKPNLVLNWMAKSQLYGAPAALLAGIGNRVVWWQHGVPESHWLDRLATMLPARAIGCSSDASAQAQERLWPSRRTFVVHPGIDPPTATADDGRHLRRVLGIPDGRHVVGIVGRLQPWKGQDRLIRAAAELRDRGREVHVLVVGGSAHGFSPEYEPELHQLVTDLALDGSVVFTGQVADASPYIAAMDVLVNASDSEPLGIVLLEGMAQGVAVVAVASGGPAEVIETEASGLLVSDGTPTQLAGAVERLVVDEVLRRRIAEAGRRRFERLFSARRMTDELHSRFEALARMT
jgi:glycosyltransferase involved in cell wall biosynthesis